MELRRREALRRYQHDPVLFCQEGITWRSEETGLTGYQEEVMRETVSRRRAAVRSPHGVGKSSTAALLVLWFAVTREIQCRLDGEDWKVVTTASAWRQVENFLWPEIHKWARRLRWDRLGLDPWRPDRELLYLGIRGLRGAAFAVVSDDPALIEGAHAKHLFYVFDESKAIPDGVFDAAEGAFMAGSDAEIMALAISTPGEPSGRFYDIQRRKAGYEDWWVRHITLEEAVAAGRIDPAIVEQRAKQWGRSSAIYQNRVLGEFATEGEQAVIPLAWVEAAVERYADWAHQYAAEPHPLALTAVGVDVGRSGEDPTTFAIRCGSIVTEVRATERRSTMETTGTVVEILGQPGDAVAVVDVIGLGAGVVDRLRELTYRVRAFNASTAARVLDPVSRRMVPIMDRSGALGFVNLRAAAWWSLREQLDPAYFPTLALPDDPILIGDLTAPRWTLTSAGRIQVESKDEIRTRLGRSTDRGDAVIQVMAMHLVNVEEEPLVVR